MTPEESKIITAAREYAKIPEHRDIDAEERYYAGDRCDIYDTFIAGAMSDSAKAFHTKGM